MQRTADSNRIVAVEVESTDALIRAVKNVSRGAVVVLGFKKLRQLDESKANTLLLKLIKYAKVKKLAILRVGRDYLIVAPPSYDVTIDQ